MRVGRPKTIKSADIISLNLTGDATSEYDYTGSTTYTAGTVVKVSYESDGTTLVVPVKLFTALQSTSVYPPLNTGEIWSKGSAINKHSMFDSRISSQAKADGTESTDPGKIVIELDSARMDAVGLFFCTCTKVIFELYDSSDTVFESKVFDNLDSLHISDLEEYFFSDFIDDHDIIYPFTSLLVSKLKIIIEHEISGEFPALGSLVLFTDFYVGQVLDDPETGIMDFSYMERDTWGNVEYEKRGHAKDMTLEVRVENGPDNSNYDKVQKTMAAITGDLTVFQGIDLEDGFESHKILGFVVDFRLVMKNNRFSICSMEIEGAK